MAVCQFAVRWRDHHGIGHEKQAPPLGPVESHRTGYPVHCFIRYGSRERRVRVGCVVLRHSVAASRLLLLSYIRIRV